MSAIFPPAAKGGVPPGPNVCNGYTPHNAVTGEGPLYIAADCTTFLTDCQLNALASEILAAVDALGQGFNATRVNNLGEALVAKFEALQTALADRVARSGDTMTGPLGLVCPPANDSDAACKKYVDDTLVDCCDDVRQHVDDAVAGFQTQIDGKVNRAGDFMTGPLSLSGDPSLPGEAATKNYVDDIFSTLDLGHIGDALQTQINNRVLRAGDSMAGPLLLARDPQIDNEAATKAYVDNSWGALVIIASSPPFLRGRPGRLWWNSATGNLFIYYADEGGSEQWVNVGPGSGGGGASGNFLPIGGGTLTGPLMLAGVPTATNEAATKQYVDSQIAGGGTFVDADADGQIYARQDNAWVDISDMLAGGPLDGGTY